MLKQKTDLREQHSNWNGAKIVRKFKTYLLPNLIIQFWANYTAVLSIKKTSH